MSTFVTTFTHNSQRSTSEPCVCVCVCFCIDIMVEHLCRHPPPQNPLKSHPRPGRQISGWAPCSSVCFYVYRHLLICSGVWLVRAGGGGRGRGGSAAVIGKHIFPFSVFTRSSLCFCCRRFFFHARPNDNRIQVSGRAFPTTNLTPQKTLSSLFLGWRVDIN